MAGSVAQTKKKEKPKTKAQIAREAKEAADKGFGTKSKRVACPGAGKPITSEKGKKQVYEQYRYSWKYPCSECDGFFAKTSAGLMNRHTRKIEEAKPFSTCAECGGEVYSIDFLCESCRDTQDMFR